MYSDMEEVWNLISVDRFIPFLVVDKLDCFDEQFLDVVNVLRKHSQNLSQEIIKSFFNNTSGKLQFLHPVLSSTNN